MKKLIALYREWRRKREWSTEKQMELLKQTIIDDNRWLAHDPTASELTERYLKILDEHWESIPIEDTSMFRDRIGLTPKL